MCRRYCCRWRGDIPTRSGCCGGRLHTSRPSPRPARVFRDLVTAYTETLIADATDDPLMRRWMAQALVSYHYEGVCTWLDEGDKTRDDEFVAMLRAGSRALVAAWVLRPPQR